MTANEKPYEPTVVPQADTQQPEIEQVGLTEVEREQVQRRAHELWAEEGQPQGRDREHWERAEMEVLKARHGRAL